METVEMETSSEEFQTFLLDTKGLCFLCFKLQDPNILEDRPKNEVPFSKIAEYAQVDLRQIFSSSDPLQPDPQDLFQKSELFVSLCDMCHSGYLRFLKFYRQLDFIKLQLKSCLATFETQISMGDGNRELVAEYTRRLQPEPFQSEIITKLRKATKSACFERCRGYLPTVSVSRLEPSDIPVRPKIEVPDPYLDEDAIEWEPGVTTLKIEVDASYLMNQQTWEPNAEYNIEATEDFKTFNYLRLNDTCLDCGQCIPHDQVLAQMKGCLLCRPSGPFECKECDKTVFSFVNLGTHSIAKHSEVPFLPIKQDNISREQFQTLIDILLNSLGKGYLNPTEQLNQNNHTQLEYDCAYCEARFKQKTIVNRHLISCHYEAVLQAVLDIQKNPPVTLMRSYVAKSSKRKRNPGDDSPMATDQEDRMEEEHVDVDQKCVIDLESDEDEDDPDHVEIPDENRSVQGPKGEPVYRCEECGKYLPKRGLTAHKRRHARAFFDCKQCPEIFSTSANLKTHSIVEHFEVPFLVFKDKRLPEPFFKALVDLHLNSVSRVHVVPETRRLARRSTKYQYDCTYCSSPTGFYYKARLRSHLIQNHFSGICQDLLQMQKYPQLELLQSHAAKLAKSKTEKAAIIQLNTKDVNPVSKKPLDDSRVDSRVFRKVPKRPKKNMFSMTNTVCENCGNDLVTRNQYQKHIRLECQGDANSLVMTPKSRTEPHMSSNSQPSSTAICTVSGCSKKFPNVDAMKQHQLLQHETAGSSRNGYNCNYCSKNFRFFFAYRIHLLTVHRLEMFNAYAPAPITRKEMQKAINAAMKLVIIVDTGKSGDQRCSLCDKAFKKATEIESHVVISHFDEMAVQLQVVLRTDSVNSSNPTSDTATDGTGNPAEADASLPQQFVTKRRPFYGTSYASRTHPFFGLLQSQYHT